MEREKKEQTRYDSGLKWIRASVVGSILLGLGLFLSPSISSSILYPIMIALIVALNAFALLSISSAVRCYMDDEPEWSSLFVMSSVSVIPAILIDLMFYLSPQ